MTKTYDPRTQSVTKQGEIVDRPIDPFGEYARNIDHGIRDSDHMFSAEGVLPWHGLGTIIPSVAADAQEALRYSHLDWTVEKKPVYAETDLKDGYGQPVKARIPNSWATVRSDTGLGMAVVGDRYRVVNNSEAFDWMDALLGGEGFHYKTAGSYHDGRKVWLLAQAPFPIDLPDSPIDTYVLLSNSHDGSGCVTAAVTPIRVVCQNTNRAAIRAASAIYRIRHSRSAESKLADAQKVLGLAKGAAQRMEQIAQTMAKQKMSDNEFTYFLNKLIEKPADEGRALTMVETQHEDLERCYRMAPGQEDIKGTAWGAFQAVTYYVDRVQPSRSGVGSAAENRFIRSMTTRNLGDRAFALLGGNR